MPKQSLAFCLLCSLEKQDVDLKKNMPRYTFATTNDQKGVWRNSYKLSLQDLRKGLSRRNEKILSEKKLAARRKIFTQERKEFKVTTIMEEFTASREVCPDMRSDLAISKAIYISTAFFSLPKSHLNRTLISYC